MQRMILGFLSDAHGNYRGLDICLDYLKQQADQIYFLGDAVGYFPFPNETLDRLKDAGVHPVMGNHDAMLVGLQSCTPERASIYRLPEIIDKISASNFEYIRSWPSHRRLEFDGQHFLLVHGSPADERNGYVYPDTDLTPFLELEADVIVMGHTHRSFIRVEGSKLFCNPGSCGFSRDNGNKISVLLYDTNTRKASLKHFLIDKQEWIRSFQPYIHSSVIETFDRNNIYEV